MKQDQNLRFVIIGMGYLMEYIAPCYSKLLGDKKAEQMLGWDPLCYGRTPPNP